MLLERLLVLGPLLLLQPRATTVVTRSLGIQKFQAVGKTQEFVSHCFRKLADFFDEKISHSSFKPSSYVFPCEIQ